MKSLFVGVFLISYALSSGANNLLPDELVKFASGFNCESIPDFFDRPGMVEPPYVYGYLPGDKESSAVLWCKPNAQETKKRYFLIFMTNNEKSSIGCPNKIEWPAYPGGLSLDKEDRIALSDFYYLDEKSKKGPNDFATNGPIVVSYYDGVETMFYCYKNSWLYRIRE